MASATQNNVKWGGVVGERGKGRVCERERERERKRKRERETKHNIAGA